MLILLACTAPAPFDAGAADAAADAVEVDAALHHVVSLVTLRTEEDPYEPPESRYEGMTFTHLNSADYIVQELLAMGLEPVIEEGGSGDRLIRTVWADIPGTSASDEIILVSAHHDAWFLGADDNASGVGVILEVARVMAADPGARTVRIISFDREEEGLVGAAEWARDHGGEGLYRIVNLDSVGYTDPTPGSQKSLLGLDAPDAGTFLAIIAAEGSAGDMLNGVELAGRLDLEVAGVLANSDAHAALTTDLLRSDHAPFWEMGIPGVFFTDTTEFRNPKYHTPEDTVDTLDGDFLNKVTAQTAGMVAGWAE